MPVTNVTKEELVDRARALAPEIARKAYETEQARRPLDEIIKALDDAGLFNFLVPKRWGGPELGLDTQLEVIETISSACQSTGWITAFYIGHHQFACRFSEKAQAEMFADGPRCLLPATTAAMMTAKTVSGGWEISGRAPWGSGIMHAEWLLVGADTDEGRRVFVLPAKDASYQDTWHMAGMAGTGSNDIILENVFVPEHRAEFLDAYSAGDTEGCRIHANPLYSMTLMPFIYCEVVGIFTGGLMGAQAFFEETVKKRVTTFSGQATKERPHNHIQLGQSLADVLATRELARSLVRRTNAHLASGAGFTMDDRLELKALMGFVVENCRRSVNDMLNRSGANAFKADAPLQRFFRDINMIATHAFWDTEVANEQLGRLHVGLEPNNPLV